MKTPFGPVGEAVYKRTYSRETVIPGVFETWPETVDRVVTGNLKFVYGEPHTWAREIHDEYEKLCNLMRRFAVIPAGRQLNATGVEGRQYLFNCHVSGWGKHFSEHFGFTFMRLVEGGGVGANYSTYLTEHYGQPRHPISLVLQADENHQDIDKLRPHLTPAAEFDPGEKFYVKDTREGWAEALTEVIDEAYSIYGLTDRPRTLYFDLGRIRPEGSPLVSSGGVAAGPTPLAVMLESVIGVINRIHSQGFTSPVDLMEIDHYIAVGAVAGGKRRSARMSIVRWDDPFIEDFISAKKDGMLHWSTNLSIEIDSKFTRDLHDPNSQASRVHSLACNAVLTNGEPGYWNSELSKVGETGTIIATNPCVTGDTVIATLDGPRTFKELAESGEDIQVYSWHPKTKKPVIRWMRNPRLTRKNTDVVRVTFDSGLVLRCTPDHKLFSFRGEKVEAQDLRAGQSIRAFSASRDSSGHERIHGWDSKRNAADHQWTHRMLWENFLGIDRLSDGLNVAHLDGDGCNNDMDNLALMTDLGHRRYDMPSRQENGMDGHSPNHKVTEVHYDGKADVYNGTVDDSHAYVILDPEPVAGHMSGIVSANCGEIPLEAWEACNLGHVNLEAFVDYDNYNGIDYGGLAAAHRLITRFLIRSTYADMADPIQRHIQNRNRRIGVGHFGVQGFLVKQGWKYSEIPMCSSANGILTFKGQLRYLKNVVRDTARKYSFELRIPEPVKVTTVAPTGSVAKLPGATEGIHPIIYKWYQQRIRFSKRDEREFEQVLDYMAQGFTIEDDIYDPSGMTSVVVLPTENILIAEVRELVKKYDLEFDESVVESAEDLTLTQMLEFQAMYQEFWADNAVSYTANIPEGSVSPKELEDILRAYLPRLKGTTIMVDASRDQAPYTRITEDQYLAATAKRIEDSADFECATGACGI